MILIIARATALEPIHIGTGAQSGNFHPTEKYLTSKVIRGMIGNYLFNHNKNAFDGLRMREEDPSKSRFLPAFPAGMIPTPMNIYWCKNCLSIVSSPIEGCTTLDNEDNPCGHEGKVRSGLMKESSLNNEKFKSGDIKIKTTTKCSMTRKHHRTPGAEHKLGPYTLEAIGRGEIFELKIIVNNNDVDWKEILSEAGIFYGVGGFRSKGFGALAITEIVKVSFEQYIDDNRERLENSNSILFLSPAVFKKDDKNVIVGLDQEDVSEFISKQAKLVEGSFHFRKTSTRGWSMRGEYRLEEMIPAIALGSTLQLTGLSLEEKVRLEWEGIGSDKQIYGSIKFIKGV